MAINNLYWLIALIGLSLCVCYTDVTRRQISNITVMIVTALCLSILVANQQYTALLHSFTILAVGIGLFVLDVIAAGDIKLLTAFSLAIKPEYLLITLGLIVLLGGMLAIGYLIYGILTDLKKVRQRGIPYAIPICLGCMFGIAASL
jgi:prepilin peptidase CpaA